MQKSPRDTSILKLGRILWAKEYIALPNSFFSGFGFFLGGASPEIETPWGM